MNEFDALHSRALYDPNLSDIQKVQKECLRLQYEYNQTGPGDQAKRDGLLKRMFAEAGEGCYIEPPLHANWGGHFVKLGSYVYANFNLTMVDDTVIEIGDHTMFGPNVTICTGTHPLSPELREKGMQYNLPVKIGTNCWIGAGALILPGVSIGDNSVIGAGSVVTRDIPENVLAFGNPCRVIRKLDEHDRQYYDHDRRIPQEML
ncbi:MAG: sugar O-acetyltransferase [Erysipelotrichaceae bacterium]|nr:sugar O-acetyltransferase [Erysipelotrichaceae bacterium]